MGIFLTPNQIARRASVFRLIPHIWKEGGRWHVSKCCQSEIPALKTRWTRAICHVSKLNAAIEAAKA